MDYNLQQQLNAKPVVGADEKPKELGDIITQALDKAMGTLGKFVGVNTGSLLKTGVFANVKLEDGGIKVNEMINKNNIATGAQGGFLANLVFSDVLNKEGGAIMNLASDVTAGSAKGDAGGGFSDFVGSAGSMGSFEVSNVSMASLGNLSPPSFGGGGKESGMGLA